MSAARILPPEEWERLDRIHLPQRLPYVAAENCAIAVVEEKGDIVGCVSALQVTHLEGLWISPWHRGNPGIARPLLRFAQEIPKARGERWVFSLVETDQMRGFVTRLGGHPIPYELFALGVGGPD